MAQDRSCECQLFICEESSFADLTFCASTLMNEEDKIHQSSRPLSGFLSNLPVKRSVLESNDHVFLMAGRLTRQRATSWFFLAAPPKSVG